MGTLSAHTNKIANYFGKAYTDGMVDIYTKDYCPYCIQAKTLLTELKIHYTEHDITNTPEKIEELSKKSGFKTVPQIFVGEKCLGGYNDIAKLHEEGKLIELIK